MRQIVVDVPDDLDATAVENLLADMASRRVTLNRIRTLLAEAPARVGPHTMANAARLDARWRDIESRWGLLDAETVARAAGSRASNPRAYAANQRRQRRLLGVRRGGRVLFPGFQFDSHGQPRPVIADLAHLLLDAGWREDSILLWLASPTGGLSGQTPADILDAEPDRVLRAAQRTAHGHAG
jgi:hypothetical protein